MAVHVGRTGITPSCPLLAPDGADLDVSPMSLGYAEDPQSLGYSADPSSLGYADDSEDLGYAPDPGDGPGMPARIAAGPPLVRQQNLFAPPPVTIPGQPRQQPKLGWQRTPQAFRDMPDPNDPRQVGGMGQNRITEADGPQAQG